jgi:hypothetical protein
MVTNNTAPRRSPSYRPEVKILCGEHPIFDGRIRCETCEGTGGASSPMGPCPFCRGTGMVTYGEHHQATTLGNDDATAVTSAELPAVAA